MFTAVIIYGSTTGNTEFTAETIQEFLLNPRKVKSTNGHRK